MESALYGIFTLVGFVSEISLVRCAHSFDFRYFTNSCENPLRTRFPWSNLYISNYFMIVLSSSPVRLQNRFSGVKFRAEFEVVLQYSNDQRAKLDCIWILFAYNCAVRNTELHTIITPSYNWNNHTNSQSYKILSWIYLQRPSLRFQ